MTDKTNSHTIHSMELGPMENFIYLIHDHETDTAAIVDPAWEVEKMLDYADNKGIQITDILLTHSHNDHINGLQQTLEHSDAKVHLLKPEAKFWGANLTAPVLHHGGNQISIGKSQINIMHTPGHTPGSACYHVGNDLIAGDTMFVFGCGRCDLAGSDPEVMFQTLKKMKSSLSAETILHPGHNYAPQSPTDTMESQCQGNPFLHFDNPVDFVKYRMHVHDMIRDTPYGAVSQKEARNAIK
ncbi:MBL-fold metallo-hydrolase superfamily [hydrothermal vent metagenome]|uniref:MBL-fold metallo-hydrolase superfamily n=1 Tax=hydrothermal vent metagenome TaxID=652676 RepID=A0A3B0WCC5_9ZZZZ